MRTLFCALLLSNSFLLPQAASSKPTQHNSKDRDEVTIQGCVGRLSGDYVLSKQNPAITYELQATGKIRLRKYLGQRVEVAGTESPTMSSSSDSLNKTGSASPETLTITSIKTIDKECSVQ